MCKKTKRCSFCYTAIVMKYYNYPRVRITCFYETFDNWREEVSEIFLICFCSFHFTWNTLEHGMERRLYKKLYKLKLYKTTISNKYQINCQIEGSKSKFNKSTASVYGKFNTKVHGVHQKYIKIYKFKF